MTESGRSDGSRRGSPSGVQIALVAAAAFALAFFLMDQRETRRLQQQAMEQQTALLEQQRELLERNQQQVADVVGEYADHVEQREIERDIARRVRSDHMAFAYLASGLSVASHLKVRVSEHYMMEGRFPASNHELGLPSPEALGTDGVESVGIAQDGAIRLVYGGESGVPDGVVVLQPSARADFGRVDWDCTTVDYPDISRAVPQCRYLGAGTK